MKRHIISLFAIFGVFALLLFLIYDTDLSKTREGFKEVTGIELRESNEGDSLLALGDRVIRFDGKVLDGIRYALSEIGRLDSSLLPPFITFTAEAWMDTFGEVRAQFRAILEQ